MHKTACNQQLKKLVTICLRYITDGKHVLKYTATPYLKNMGVPFGVKINNNKGKITNGDYQIWKLLDHSNCGHAQESHGDHTVIPYI